MSNFATVRMRGQGWGADDVWVRPPRQAASQPGVRDRWGGGGRHSGLNLNRVQYRSEAGEAQGRRTWPEEKSKQTFVETGSAANGRLRLNKKGSKSFGSLRWQKQYRVS